MTATLQRLRRVRAILAEQHGPDFLDARLAQAEKEGGSALVGQLLDAVCDAWLGPMQRRYTRSDKGFWRGPRDWSYTGMRCQLCGGAFEPSRVDAVYCSNACRQRAYRQRG